MSRAADDPRVVEILAAFERHVNSPEREDCPDLLDLFMKFVLDTNPDRFLIPCAWPLDALRAVLLAFAVNAPEKDLDDMLEKARAEMKWIADFEKGAA